MTWEGGRGATHPALVPMWGAPSPLHGLWRHVGARVQGQWPLEGRGLVDGWAHSSVVWPLHSPYPSCSRGGGAVCPGLAPRSRGAHRVLCAKQVFPLMASETALTIVVPSAGSSQSAEGAGAAHARRPSVQ